MCRNNWVSKVASSGRQWIHCISPMCQVDEAMGCDMVRWTTSCLVDNLVTVGAIVVTSVKLTYVSRSDLYQKKGDVLWLNSKMDDALLSSVTQKMEDASQSKLIMLKMKDVIEFNCSKMRGCFMAKINCVKIEDVSWQDLIMLEIEDDS